MRIRDRLFKGTRLNLIAVMFNQGSTFIVNIIVARLLLKLTFGQYVTVQSTLLTIASLAALATGYTASKYIAEYRLSDPERAGRIMGLCELISIVMAGIGTQMLISMAPWLAVTMLNAPHLFIPLIIGSGYLFFSCVNGYQAGALSGLEAFGGLARAGVFSGIIAVGSISFGAWGGGLNGAVLGLSISALSRCVIHNRILRHESRMQLIKPQYNGSFNKEKEVVLKFAIPAAISGLYMAPMIWLAQSILVRQPKGYEEMALFSAANNLRIMVLFLPQVINNVGLSLLNNEKGNGDIHRYNTLFRLIVLIMFLVSLVVALPAGLFGRYILQLFGKEFASGQLILWILLLTSIIESLSTGIYQYVQTQSKLWLSLFFITIPREACLVIVSFTLVKSYAGVGLATAYLSSISLGLILTFSVALILSRRAGISLIRPQ